LPRKGEPLSSNPSIRKKTHQKPPAKYNEENRRITSAVSVE
jgi:hypothetical protein